MAEFTPVNHRNFRDVLSRFGEWWDEQDEDQQDITCDDFDDFLDDLLNSDAFGTEGQLDPRGDHRD